jgi:hypothetical protein
MVEQAKINRYIDELKQIGYRPTLVGALVKNKRVALFENNEYKGFEFIQGGFEHGENPKETLEREIIEELGYWFHHDCNFSSLEMIYLFEDKMNMKVKGKLQTSTKEEFSAKGKHYVVFAAVLDNGSIDFPQISPEDYSFTGTSVKLHQCRWVDAKTAHKLLSKISNPKKREMASKTIDLLLRKELIS